MIADVRWVIAAELRKFTHQNVARLLAAAAVVLPILFTVVVKSQGATPGDTLFGAFIHTSGYDVPLVAMAFTASFGFPIAAALLAGDIFASEDRHDTWKNVLARGMDRRAIFLGKYCAAALLASGFLVVIAVLSTASGVLIVGAHPLTGLSGQTISSGAAFGLTLAAWALNLPPLLAFVALGVLASVVTQNGIAGVLVPIVLALIMQLLAHVGNGGLGHQLLLLAAFDAWHGLFTRPLLALPLVAIGVSLVWGGLALGVAWRLFSARDFGGAGSVAARARGVFGITAGLIATVVVMVALCFTGPTQVTVDRLQTELAPVFNRLAADQTLLLRHQALSPAAIRDHAVCLRKGGASSGAGDDWVCTVDVDEGAAGTGLGSYGPLEFELSVKPDACYSADGDPNYVGAQSYRASDGARVTNPLFEFYGCFSPL